jgi:magnesium chelatase family protein
MMLVAAMNPCPCGHAGSPAHACICSAPDVQRYRDRVSGPLLDRIDIHVTVPPVRYRDLSPAREGETSRALGDRVRQARARQTTRFARLRGTHCNAQMTPRQIRRFCEVDAEGAALLQNVIDRVGMSARAYDRILKVARTIADLDESEAMSAGHVSEAISYRTLDRRLSG